MKKRIIELIQESNRKYWERFPDEFAQDLSEEQQEFINKLDEETAEAIMNELKEVES